MARTKADSCSRKAVAAKAPRKVMSPGSSTSKVKLSKSGRSAGNRYCPRPTPPWQKEISNFFVKSPRDTDDNLEISSSPSTAESSSSEPGEELNEPGPSKSYQESDDSD